MPDSPPVKWMLFTGVVTVGSLLLLVWYMTPEKSAKTPQGVQSISDAYGSAWGTQYPTTPLQTDINTTVSIKDAYGDAFAPPKTIYLPDPIVTSNFAPVVPAASDTIAVVSGPPDSSKLGYKFR